MVDALFPSVSTSHCTHTPPHANRTYTVSVPRRPALPSLSLRAPPSFPPLCQTPPSLPRGPCNPPSRLFVAVVVMRSFVLKKRPKSGPPCVHQSQAQNFRGDSSPRETLAEQPPAPPMDAGGKCLSCREEKTVARRYRWRVIGGLIFPFALQALDVTM